MPLVVANVREDDDPTFGDVWTYCAIDAETKLVPSYKVASKRNLPNTVAFIDWLKVKTVAGKMIMQAHRNVGLKNDRFIKH